MKKYMMPEIELLEMETAELLEGSIGIYNDETVDDPSDILSRDIDFEDFE